MRIHVKFFAIVKDKAGVDQTTLELPEGADVDAAVQALGEKFAAISGALRRCAFAVNMNYVKSKQILHDRDELAIIPPVSGG